MTTKTAICPGSFDPPTLGHINIIERAALLFDRVIVAVVSNPDKKAALSIQDRVSLLKEIVKEHRNVEVESVEDQLLVDYARSKGATVLLKGLRTIRDYEYEFQMALANKTLAPEIETVFMLTDPRYSYLSSSLVKEIVSLGGSASGMVPPMVQRRLREKFEKGPRTRDK